MIHSRVKIHKTFGVTVAATFFIICTIFFHPGETIGASFEGKTVRLIVNQLAGSTTDVTTRQVAPYIEKYLPGKPQLIVENVHGGRGALAASYMNNKAKPDGLTAGVLSVIPGRWALGADLKVDLSKFKIVGARGSNSAMLVRTDAGYNAIEDLIKSEKPVIFGTAAPYSPNTILAGLFFNAIGVKYKAISGYRGQVKAFQAILTNEVNFVQLNSNIYLPKRESMMKDNIKGILQWGEIKPDGKCVGSKRVGLETVESAWRRLSPGTVDKIEFNIFREIIKANGIFFLYVLHPDTPSDIVKAWAAAFDKGYADPEYLSSVRKTGADDPVVVDAATAAQRLKAFRPFFQQPDAAKVLDKFRPKKTKKK